MEDLSTEKKIYESLLEILMIGNASMKEPIVCANATKEPSLEKDELPSLELDNQGVEKFQDYWNELLQL